MKKKFLIILICCSTIAFSQKQPKVGLVLSGGGAKGFAHIGVLKEIEKAGVQIDMIGGTSMGAIVGGLYATGYSADQIEKIITDTDFMKLLRDENPRETIPFSEKDNGEKTFITLPVIDGAIGFPRAISKGQNVLGFMTSLLHPVDSIPKFEKLQIPFFCVATDIETGQEVLLEEGSLPLSLRASGSFPTLLSPVDINGKLLIDGGVSNNFPADIMKERGADIIIGVDVQGKLYQRSKLKSAVDILNQIVSYKMYEKSAEQLKSIDVYIHPEIHEYTVIDFEKSKEILKKGELAASEKREFFKRIANLQTNKKKRTPIEILEKRFRVDKIKISGNDRYTRGYILGKLNLKKKDSASMQQLAKQVTFLSSTDNFDRINFRVYLEEGQNVVDFKIKESREKASLSLGVHYDFLYKSGLLINYKHKRLLRKNDLLSVDLVLGDRIRFDATYFIDNGFYTSVGVKTRYNHFRAEAPFTGTGGSNINKVNIRYSDLTTQAFIQTAFKRKFAIGLGAEFKALDVSTETLNNVNTNAFIFDNSNYVNAFGYLKFDSYNKKTFPNRGFFADIDATYYAWSSDFLENFKPFLQASGTIGFAASFFDDKFTFQYTGQAGFSFNNPTSNVFDFYLGGNNQNYINTFYSFFGYEFGELSNKSFLKSEFNVRHQFYPDNYLVLIANYARLQDNLLRDINIFENIKSGYAVGYSYDSPVGPIELKYTWSPDNGKKFFVFNLGFWF